MSSMDARYYISTVLASLAIGIGGMAYLATGYAWLFPIGLSIVCLYGLNLFTGKVGYTDFSKGSFVWLFVMVVVNIVSAYLMGIVVRLGGFREGIIFKAEELYTKKLESLYGASRGLLGVFLAGVFCNILIFIAVDSYKKIKQFGTVVSLIMLWFATMIFVYSGYEHCVANAFYFGLAGRYEISELAKQAGFLGVNILGNAAGAIVIKQLLYFNKEGND